MSYKKFMCDNCGKVLDIGDCAYHGPKEPTDQRCNPHMKFYKYCGACSDIKFPAKLKKGIMGVH